jgi:hypothetical protein
MFPFEQLYNINSNARSTLGRSHSLETKIKKKLKKGTKKCLKFTYLLL